MYRTMSAPPRADFVVGCPQCRYSLESDSLTDVAWFYACHRTAGHEVEWLWGSESTLTDEIEVAEDGRVTNLGTVVGVLVGLFHPSRVPAELVLENCLNAGAEKAVVERQLEELPELIRSQVELLD